MHEYWHSSKIRPNFTFFSGVIETIFLSKNLQEQYPVLWQPTIPYKTWNKTWSYQIFSCRLILSINLKRRLFHLPCGERPWGIQGEYRTDLGNGVSVSWSFRIILLLVSFKLTLFFLCQATGLLEPSVPKYSPMLRTLKCYIKWHAHLVL